MKDQQSISLCFYTALTCYSVLTASCRFPVSSGKILIVKRSHITSISSTRLTGITCCYNRIIQRERCSERKSKKPESSRRIKMIFLLERADGKTLESCMIQWGGRSVTAWCPEYVFLSALTEKTINDTNSKLNERYCCCPDCEHSVSDTEKGGSMARTNVKVRGTNRRVRSGGSDWPSAVCLSPNCSHGSACQSSSSRERKDTRSLSADTFYLSGNIKRVFFLRAPLLLTRDEQIFTGHMRRRCRKLFLWVLSALNWSNLHRALIKRLQFNWR